jgi:hypothetical protein
MDVACRVINLCKEIGKDEFKSSFFFWRRIQIRALAFLAI